MDKWQAIHRQLSSLQAQVAELRQAQVAMMAALRTSDQRNVGTAEAANILGISVGALNARVNRGTVPVNYANGHRTFRVADLHRLLTNNDN